MAVHGTRNRDSVSWNYAGILQVLRNVARDRTGLPLLRCYWYEATAEGRRTPEHEALADLPGVKLRFGRRRPGHRGGVESEIHRDLTTLARNGAISDALIVSAEEDLARVVSDVQDLGIRVILVHIPVAGSWTVSAALRQECDDLVEISAAHLRPTVELVVGAEPVVEDERHAVGAYTDRAPANGHGPPGTLGPQQALPVGSHTAPPAIYTGPAIADYQQAAQPTLSQPAAAANSSGAPAAPPAAAQPRPSAGPAAPMPPGFPGAAARPGPAAQPGMPQPGQPGPRMGGQHAAGQPDAAVPAGHGQHGLPPQHALPPGQPGAPGMPQQFPAPGGAPQPYPPGPPGRPTGPHDRRGAQQYQAPPPGHSEGGPYVPPQGPHSGPQPTAQHAPVPQPVAVSLADAVQAAHGEGFTFGQAVARDAPALWLEAVLARKPRMPSDLEARLLQDSSLPIDSLLHDEVRHALRRGFWDALERVRH
jgi:uncharacterized LabA/DUF88 family protein